MYPSIIEKVLVCLSVMKTLLFVLVVLVPTLSHASKIDIAPEGNRLTKAGLVSLWSDWIKNKGKKYDISFHIKNESEKPIIIMLGEMHCFRGSVEGELKHTFFNTGEKTINFRGSETKNFTLVCQLDEKLKGDYRILVKQVYENAGGDGKTLGKVLGKDLDWKVSIAGE